MVGFARDMEGLDGEVPPASVEKALLEMPPTPMPLADGLTFQCDRKQVSIAPNICSLDVLQTTLDADGKAGEFTVLSGAEVLDLG